MQVRIAHAAGSERIAHAAGSERIAHAAGAVAPTPDWRLAAVLVVLVGVAVTASYVGRLGVERDHLTAAARAVVQLAAVSLVIAAVLGSVAWSLTFVLLMFVVATFTSAGRIRVPRRQVPWVALAIASGAVPVLALIFASGLVPFNGAGIVPIAGIVVGNMMTAATLTGRRAYDEIGGSFGTYEVALALGLTSQEAAFEVVQPTAKEGCLPRAWTRRVPSDWSPSPVPSSACCWAGAPPWRQGPRRSWC